MSNCCEQAQLLSYFRHISVDKGIDSHKFGVEFKLCLAHISVKLGLINGSHLGDGDDVIYPRKTTRARWGWYTYVAATPVCPTFDRQTVP